MGTDVTEAVGTLPYPYSFKVHRVMCTELMKLVERTMNIFPQIEAARPRCSSGIQTLCLLNNAIEKAKLILQYCRESSKLYLALTGDVIALRCQRSRNLLEQSLSQVQNMVPVMLAVEISRIIDDLKVATFVLDSNEEEAGKVVRELLQLGASTSESLECSETNALQLAAQRLHITTPKDLLIERRSVKKLLDQVGDNELPKKKILKYLLHLLKKYGNLIMEQIDNACAQEKGSFSVSSQSVEVDSCTGCNKYEAQTEILSRAIPPEEFKCPLSSKLMYDPVIIESGQTFERTWIQKWLDDGNDTCPKTEIKLVRQSLTPNTVMKDLISKWCATYGITIADPSMRMESLCSWDASMSIASFGSSMNDLRLPLDVSNVSVGSLDTSYNSDTAHNKIADGLSLTSVETNNDFHRFQASSNIIEADLSRLGELNWEDQYKVVENITSLLKHSSEACYSLSSMNFIEPLVRFLRNARDIHDVRAQRVGFQLLLACMTKSRYVVLRSGIPCLDENVFLFLASFLDSEVSDEAFAIFEELSRYRYCRSYIVSSGVLASIVKILDSENRELKEHSIKILHNLSLDNESCSQIPSSECIPKLVPFLKDTTLAEHCIKVLKNMCDIEGARVIIAETSGCLASVVELLEMGRLEEQEQAVSILLSLCSQRVRYCHLVMNEGVIPSLVSISINGNDKGKVMALELLRLLRDVQQCDELECIESDHDTSRDSSNYTKEKKASSKSYGFFMGKFSMFSKTHLARSKKREMKLGV
ncbi:U-box domain-containing protein 5-like isoform X1 [Mangifera indica]|uniref:U-box domain-containing protein 5-like isoform X1 n=2 Tax=Mangifera indica TaxID=29780 RepID=UPI001CF98B6D|nr:U-box domain-containing protein 5-like isoform X1 [Mangifera indica]XP_044480675.1 U-box domain-containing protein 5-like isoform X1 [Mangifera indica]